MSKKRGGRTTEKNKGSSFSWRGQPCDVLTEQHILTSGNDRKKCFVIRIHHLEMYKALRLVDAIEVVET